MRISKTLDYILDKNFGAKCRSCKHLRGVPNKGKNVKMYCAEKITQFPFSKDCAKWEAEWQNDTSQSITIGDYLATQAGIIKQKVKDI
jgi:hypothetical protein